MEKNQTGSSFRRSWIHVFIKGLKQIHQQISSEAKESKGLSKDGIQGLLQIFDNQSKEDTLASFPVFKEA